ncbi:MAG: peptidylprolyl isomerase [bacterium]
MVQSIAYGVIVIVVAAIVAAARTAGWQPYSALRTSRLIASLAAMTGAMALLACSPGAPDVPPVVSGPAPDSFRVAFTTSRGTFVVGVTRAWAPHGADRFRELVLNGFFDDDRFFRVVPEFVAQFGINDSRKLNEAWDAKPIADDSVRGTNKRGAVVFASEGPGTRSHQVFVNLTDQVHLDKMGFAPIGRVVEGMGVVDSLYSAYGENPSQHLVQTLGNSYLRRMFPKLDYIISARVVGDGAGAAK